MFLSLRLHSHEDNTKLFDSLFCMWNKCAFSDKLPCFVFRENHQEALGEATEPLFSLVQNKCGVKKCAPPPENMENLFNNCLCSLVCSSSRGRPLVCFDLFTIATRSPCVKEDKDTQRGF